MSECDDDWIDALLEASVVCRLLLEDQSSGLGVYLPPEVQGALDEFRAKWEALDG